MRERGESRPKFLVWCWWVGLVSCAVLTLTGVWLFVAYQPDGPVFSNPVIGADTVEAVGGSRALTNTHLVATVTLCLAVVVAVVGAAMSYWSSRGTTDPATPADAQSADGTARFGERPVLSMIQAAATLATTVVAAIIGPMLAWDQLALASVSAGMNVSGIPFRSIDDNEVMFVLVGTRELAPEEYLLLVGAHLLLAGLVAVLWAGRARWMLAVGGGRPAEPIEGEPEWTGTEVEPAASAEFAGGAPTGVWQRPAAPPIADQ